MKPDEYWTLRALQREAQSHDDAAGALLRLRLIYEEADKELSQMIGVVFKSYQKYTGLDEQKARELLSVQETAELLTELRKEYEANGGAEILAKLNAPAYGYRISRLQAVRKAIDAGLDKLAGQEEKTGSGQLVKAYDDSYYKTMYDTLPELPTPKPSAPETPKVPIPTDDISTEKTPDIPTASTLPDEITPTPVTPLSQEVVNQAVQSTWKGENYSSRVWKNRDVLAKEAGRIIDAGTTAGKSIQQMTTELSDLMNVGSYAAARLLRTEVNRMHNDAAMQSYQAMGVKEYTYLATLDARTCSVCGALDLKVFQVSEAKTGVNLPPMHPNDRCTVAPKIPGAENDGNRTARDPETGRNYKVPAGMTYEEWRKSIGEKYGADSLKTAQTKYWNRKADTVQLKDFKKVLGKDAPKDLEELQQQKYNEPEKWEQLKQAAADQKIRDAIRAGEYPSQVNEEKQARHVQGSGYIKGRSYLTLSLPEVQKLVDQYKGTGQIVRRGGAVQEIIHTEKQIGYVFDPVEQTSYPATDFKIHYSKTGVHVVPYREAEKTDESSGSPSGDSGKKKA